MKQLNILCLIALTLLALSINTFSQIPPTQPGHFDKDGLSFDYPNGWTVTDDSIKEALEIGVPPQPGLLKSR